MSGDAAASRRRVRQHQQARDPDRSPAVPLGGQPCREATLHIVPADGLLDRRDLCLDLHDEQRSHGRMPSEQVDRPSFAVHRVGSRDRTIRTSSASSAARIRRRVPTLRPSTRPRSTRETRVWLTRARRATSDCRHARRCRRARAMRPRRRSLTPPIVSAAAHLRLTGARAVAAPDRTTCGVPASGSRGSARCPSR